METLTFRNGVVAKATSCNNKDYNFEIKNGALYFRGEKFEDKMLEEAEDKKEFLKTLKAAIADYNREVKAIEELQTEVNALAKEVNSLPGRWDELKDLRKKAAFELKQATCAKLNDLAHELKESGMWPWVKIGIVDYYDYGREDNKYDERTQLVWEEDRGFYFEQEECEQDGGELVWKTKKCHNVKSFDSLEELGRTNIKRLAKQLPDRIRQLTESYKRDISEMERLKHSIL